MSPQVFDASKFNEVKRYGKTKSNVLALSLKENASGQEGREAQKKRDTDNRPKDVLLMAIEQYQNQSG